MLTLGQLIFALFNDLIPNQGTPPGLFALEPSFLFLFLGLPGSLKDTKVLSSLAEPTPRKNPGPIGTAWQNPGDNPGHGFARARIARAHLP